MNRFLKMLLLVLLLTTPAGAFLFVLALFEHSIGDTFNKFVKFIDDLVDSKDPLSVTEK